MGNHFGENFSALPKVQEFPTSVGCAQKIATNLSEHFGTTCKNKFSYLHENGYS